MNPFWKTLVVDLSTGEVEMADLPKDSLVRFLGGRGINAWLLYQRVREETDPLSPDNVLLLSCGLLTGGEAPASSRLHVNALSPLTGLLGSSNVGGDFGARLHAAGFQTVLIKGEAKHPSMIWIHDDQVDILEAEELWGVDVRMAAEAIRERLGKDTRVMLIGPGGENLVRYACIMTDEHHAAGRTGMGAVMGAKNLKAIAVSAQKHPSKRDGAIRSLVREYAERIRSSPRYEIYSKYSNSAYINWANESGILATRNYRQAQYEAAGQIDGTQMIKYVTHPKSCHRCPVHCKAELRIASGRYAGLIGERPDIEPTAALGARCGVTDVEALLYLYNLAGTLGIDVISTAASLAFVMDLDEQGFITLEDTDGIEMTWGNAEAMEAMMYRIAQREGFGAILAEGVRRAAQIIGRGAEVYAYHSKGLELTAYEPRAALASALGYAVSNRGADWTSVYPVVEFRWDAKQGRAVFGNEKAVDRFSPEGKGLVVKRTMSVSAALDSLGLCKVPVLSVVGDFSLEEEARLVKALTGLPLTASDLLIIGERILNVERLFNLRHGATKADDDLPDKFTEEPLPNGPGRGMTVPIEQMVREFYAVMGWDEEGRPTQETLRKLGLAA